METVLVVEGRYTPWYAAINDYSCAVTKHTYFVLAPVRWVNREALMAENTGGCTAAPSAIKTIPTLLAPSHINRDLIWDCFLSTCASRMSFTKELYNPLETSKHEENSGFASHLLENLYSSHYPFLPLKASTAVFLTPYEGQHSAKHSNPSSRKHKLLMSMYAHSII